MKPAILNLAGDGRISLFIQFGGQAGDWFKELKRGWDGVPPAKDLIERVSSLLVKEAISDDARYSGLLNRGIDICSWLEDPASVPASGYLASSAISQPAIFLTQTTNLISADFNGLRLSELYGLVKGTSGHSQGVMASILFSMSLDKEEFIEAACNISRWLFWQGIRMQEAFPSYALPQSIVQSAIDEGFGMPSPMLSVTGIVSDKLKLMVDEFNRTHSLSECGGLNIALINSYERSVVSGRHEDILLFARSLKEECRSEFIQTSAPFHSPYMKKALTATASDIRRLNIRFDSKSLKIPVFATDSGENLQNSQNLVQDLLKMMHTGQVNWSRVCGSFVRMSSKDRGNQLIDFGPGEISARLSDINLAGCGFNIIPFAADDGRRQIFSASEDDIRFQNSWERYIPKPISQMGRSAAVPKVNNKYTEFTGYPPIFGGGMTPTTMEGDIVAAAANAGFIVELAGGGQVTEEIFRKRLDKIVKNLDEGRGIIINTLFLDPYLWNLHYRLIPRLKNEGYPITGVTISAGVPAKDEALAILDRFNGAGIWCNSFKVGREEQIEDVLEIADTAAMTIILQVEGGKGGGHHSWEDLNGLMLRNYAKIRRRDNIILCVGGGIYEASQAYSWLKGTWHNTDRLSPMPVDAVFIGTRLMACKEAKTSPQVKRWLAGLEGTDGWIKKGDVKGGMTSLESQLGADIYYAENSAAAACRFIDSLKGEGDKIAAHKNKIIGLLNKTCKPYFGDLYEMTYAEVIKRMLELMAPSGGIAEHIPHYGRWYDVTYKRRVFEFAKRMKERLCLLSEAKRRLLHPEDVDYFIWLCGRPGKPVNFVPVIDENVARWFKSDSLWQSHDPRYGADSVFFMPGPASACGIKKIDEPVADIFGSFERHISDSLARDGFRSVRRDEIEKNGRMPPSNAEVRAIYKRLWGDKNGGEDRPPKRFEKKITREDIKRFAAAVGEEAKAFKQGVEGRLCAPLNMAFVFAWEAVASVIWRELKEANLLKLVHLSNRIETVSAAGGFIKEGDIAVSSAFLGGIEAEESGCVISIISEVNSDSGFSIKMESRFFVRGLKTDVVAAELALPNFSKASFAATKFSKASFAATKFSKASFAATSGKVNFAATSGKASFAATLPFAKGEAYIPLKSPKEVFKEDIYAPIDTGIYAGASSDYNPIHLDDDLARSAGFKKKIVHGMWTSSAALALVIKNIVPDAPELVLSWQVDFDLPVYPSERLSIACLYTGNVRGMKVYKLKAVNKDDAVVMRGRCVVRPPSTAYIFTGQGSQEEMMGMDGYARSNAARRVWDEADEICKRELGFSILKTVRENPKEMIAGGKKVFHPKGVLHLTQFTQVALTVLAMAQIEELKEAGLYNDEAVFCGHSLGEYAALSCSGIIPLKDVLKTVYKRGLAMQNYVPRDKNGLSPYKMCVVRPNIAGLTHEGLDNLVREIASEGSGSIEIVNYNIEGEQYSVTGESRLLSILESRLKELEAKRGEGKNPSLIYLEGIDVPFHSSVLRPGVEAFRQTLEETIPEDINPALLVNRYIPNLNARPFELTAEFITDVYKLTGSPVLKGLSGGTKAARLLLIELLAYQFASPVRWIETQKRLFGMGRIVEIGQRPILSNMMLRTLAKNQNGLRVPGVIHVNRNRRELFYED